MATFQDFYKTLGVPETATAEEIKKAYRKLAKKNHPDATGGDKTKESRFKEISEAYETLGEAEKRTEYDALRKNPFGAGNFRRPSPGPGAGSPFSSEGPFAAGARRAGRGGARTQVDMNDFSDLFGGGAAGKEKASGFSDIFSQYFGGGAAEARPPEPVRGGDMKARVDVDLGTAALGGSLPIDVDGKRLTVKVPAGIEDGQVIRVTGYGQPGPAGPGDMLLELHVRPHERFRRLGDDLEVDVQVQLDEAVLGGKVEVPTLEKPVQLTVPPGTSSGRKLRLKGKGARHRGSSDSRGDLYAVIQISVPRDISEKARELIQEFARLTRT